MINFDIEINTKYRNLKTDKAKISILWLKTMGIV